MASAYTVLILFFIIFEIITAAHQQRCSPSHLINPDSSLSPSRQPSSWNSSSGRFQFGFYKQGTGYSVGIWLVTPQKNIIVWTANRDDPPVSSNAMVTLMSEGKLVLHTEESDDKVIASADQETPSSACMLDSGNFVLYNQSFGIIWSSFNFPTDTILGEQSLPARKLLFSSVSETNSSTGLFCLKMQADGNLVLYPKDTLDVASEAYWASGTNIHKEISLYLNDIGELQLLTSSRSVEMILSSESCLGTNSSIIYRATLGHDGVLRLYCHCLLSDGTYNTSVIWKKPDDLCLVKTSCGLNAYCRLYGNQRECRCLPGTGPLHSNGCERNFVGERCAGKINSSELHNMTAMPNMTWDDYPYFKTPMLEKDCIRSCLEDCDCDAALYDGYNCMKNKLPLKYARIDQEWSTWSIAYIKTGRSSDDNNTYIFPPPETLVRIKSKNATIVILVITVGCVSSSCILLAICGFFIFKYRVNYKRLLETGSLGLTDELALRSFSYYELKKATKGFKEELGKGSFGAVYKGNLYKGEKLVAVKRLEKMVTEGEKEFRAEMHVIGRTHHKNLVRLLGYCAEDSKRLLVYEYMSNGSLADVLFRGSERPPDWNERARIALDVAKGILYLHDECEAPIIHCDIKPQNILMDEFRTAKISDFGLAKLLMPDQTRTFTIMRGTRGYLAPEWSKNIPISVKADVYSYGVVLLEIVCCRRNMEIDPSKPEEIVLVNWVYKCFIEGVLNNLVRGQEVDKRTFENMVMVGLWCVQDEPALRPSMKSVVMMLEGITDAAIPPCPTASSA
ncbi:putative Receptor-like protein kinase 1 [Melia azedarach]|uniref:Receptor-like protein kinase 1 n=1 Tax=Melia azedarach TaxID=155640 RepID=A0ACC1XUW6_MELAZ|nr:putative Receptor-like protein kinase 1 [Melia azedarach]